MLTTMVDLSDHESGDDENHDPKADFTAFIPDATNLMDSEGTLEGVDGSDEALARTVGPISDRFAGLETATSIPAYVVIDAITNHTANLEDVHQSATLIQRGPDWNFYEFAGTKFRVRTFQTREERQFEATMERTAENGDFDEVAE